MGDSELGKRIEPWAAGVRDFALRSIGMEPPEPTEDLTHRRRVTARNGSRVVLARQTEDVPDLSREIPISQPYVIIEPTDTERPTART